MSCTGNWKIIISSPIGDQESSLVLKEAGSKLTGTQTSAFGSGEIQNGAIDGNKAAWTIDITQPISATLEFTAQINGNEIAGVVKVGAFGESRFKGVRT